MNELSVLNVLFQKVMHSPGFKRAYWSLKLLNFMNCDQSSSLWTNCRILLESLWVNETQLRHLRRISELRGFTMSRMSKVFRISSKNGPLVLEERFFVFFWSTTNKFVESWAFLYKTALKFLDFSLWDPKLFVLSSRSPTFPFRLHSRDLAHPPPLNFTISCKHFTFTDPSMSFRGPCRLNRRLLTN